MFIKQLLSLKVVFLLLGRGLLATLGLLGTQTLATILLQDAGSAVSLGALLQCVEGDGQQLVALALSITQLEAVKVVQRGALQGNTLWISTIIAVVFAT